MFYLILKFFASLIGYGVGSSYLKKKEAARQAERNKEIDSCLERAAASMKMQEEYMRAYWERVNREKLEQKNRASKENDKKV